MTFKSSLQRDLDRFYKQVNKSAFSIREVTKSAFSQSRSKLDPLVFKELNTIAADTFYQSADFETWNGMRLLSTDGSGLMLPNHPTIVEEFGQHSFGPKADKTRSLATVSMLYDVLNLVTIDAQMNSYTTHELDLFEKHTQHLKPCDLLLCDRGYACFWAIFLLQAKGVSFCMRMRDAKWKVAIDFLKSSENERFVEFSLPVKDRNRLSQFPQWWEKKIICRLIKVVLDNGTIEVLCTSLLDQKENPIEEFKELYHYRWGEEEAYKMLKSRVEIEQFSGKTALAVKQDFYAKVFAMTLCAINAFPIEEKVKAEYKKDGKRKHDQQINRTSAMSMTHELIIGSFIQKQFQSAIQAFDSIVENTREIIRPDRSFPRNHQQKKPYSMNYKPL
jgi:hypothetical protein